MKINNRILFFITILSISLLTSCNDDEVALEPGEFALEFDSRVGDANLQLNTANTLYTNAKGQTFNVTMLRYYSALLN
jgi:hypothetical protein